MTYHVHGRLEAHDPTWRLTGDESEALVYQLLGAEERKAFEQTLELDLAFSLLDVARFRVSVLRQKGSVGAVLRLVPLTIPHYTELGLTQRIIMQLAATANGLVLVTGPTGAGKSTTIASFLEFLNREGDTPRHIITIEDPIEFFFHSQVCVIDQREIGRDTQSYVRGLRSALRQMPHIIFVGEMRDRETIEVALTAAETGNLVISTLSTQSAAKTINRIIDVFPVDHQAEIRTRLALTLKTVISQVLLKRIDAPGRVAARELLFTNSAVANLIREGKIHQLDNLMAGAAREGMLLLDDSLLELYRTGVVDAASVVPRIQDREKLRRVALPA